jgi:hypothetical protein
MLSLKNQAVDTWTLLQVSPNFRASDKYSYNIYKQLRLIFNKLEISVTALLWSAVFARPVQPIVMFHSAALTGGQSFFLSK